LRENLPSTLAGRKNPIAPGLTFTLNGFSGSCRDGEEDKGVMITLLLAIPTTKFPRAARMI
jgi:hypothetical protein